MPGVDRAWQRHSGLEESTGCNLSLSAFRERRSQLAVHESNRTAPLRSVPGPNSRLAQQVLFARRKAQGGATIDSPPPPADQVEVADSPDAREIPEDEKDAAT